jgi:hypothetical protein
MSFCLVGCAAIRNEQVKTEMADIRANQKAADDQCIADLEADRSLDPIRDKIELRRANAEAPPPFSLLSNTNYPSAQEREAIVAWERERERCRNSKLAINDIPAHADGFDANFLREMNGLGLKAGGQVDALTVALSQGRMTYGEFAQKRYEVGRDLAEASRQFRQAALEADFQRRQQEGALAVQQFQAVTNAWGTYMQTIQARQPVITTGNCMAMGNTMNCTAISR